MTAPDPPNIPPPAPGHKRPGRAPLREEIARSTVGIVKAGGASKADLVLVDTGSGPVVVKDFAAKPWWSRLLGRIQIAREVRAYEWLDGMRGVPEFLGRIDRHALAIEKIEGEQLAFARDRLRNGETLVARLREVLDRLHERGVVHHDLRGRENVMVRPDGEVVIVDLAGAMCLRPGSLAHRLFYRFLVLTDEAAYLKWKMLLAPDRLTDEEKRFERRFRFFRSLWIFNRKRVP